MLKYSTQQQLGVAQGQLVHWELFLYLISKPLRKGVVWSHRISLAFLSKHSCKLLGPLPWSLVKPSTEQQCFEIALVFEWKPVVHDESGVKWSYLIRLNTILSFALDTTDSPFIKTACFVMNEFMPVRLAYWCNVCLLILTHEIYLTVYTGGKRGFHIMSSRVDLGAIMQ